MNIVSGQIFSRSKFRSLRCERILNLSNNATGMELTRSDTNLSEPRHSYHKGLSVAKETLLVLETIAVVPLSFIEAWNEDIPRPCPEGRWTVYLMKKETDNPYNSEEKAGHVEFLINLRLDCT